MPNRTRLILGLAIWVGTAGAAGAQDATATGWEPVNAADTGLASSVEAPETADPIAAAEEPPRQPLPPYAEDPIADEDLLLRSSYDAPGIRIGSFIAYPAVETGVVHTSNVHQSASDRDSDFGLVVAPELRLESDWSRHAVGLTATSSHVRYGRYHRENLDDATVSASARVDVTARTALDLNGSFALGQEDRDSIEIAQGAVGSTDVTTWQAGAGLTQRFNRVTLLLRGDIDLVEYGDTELAGGASVDNGDRDYLETSGTLRLGYEVSPVLQPFIEGSYSVRDHHRTLDRDGFRRDSHGIAAAAGVAINLGPILRGEVSAGYEYRDYDDDALKPAEGVTFDADLIWAPTRLTTVTVGAETTVAETTVLGASAALSHGVDAEISHSLSYNLTARAGGSYRRSEYPGTSIVEDRIGATAALDYRANPNLVLRAGYAYRLYNSNVADSDLDMHTVRLGVRLQR